MILAPQSRQTVRIQELFKSHSRFFSFAWLVAGGDTSPKYNSFFVSQRRLQRQESGGQHRQEEVSAEGPPEEISSSRLRRIHDLLHGEALPGDLFLMSVTCTSIFFAWQVSSSPPRIGGSHLVCIERRFKNSYI